MSECGQELNWRELALALRICMLVLTTVHNTQRR